MGVVRRVVSVVVLVGLCGAVPAGSASAQEAEAPGRVGRVAGQTVTVGETLDVDVAEAFSGTVATYAVSSSNTAVVEVSVDGSVVSLTGAASGYAFVTVTATNAAGSATQRFWVDTELAEPPPGLAVRLGAESTTVGAIAALDLTPVFTRRVLSHGATSSDTTVLETTVDGSIVILRGISAGSATATVSATNLGGTRTTSLTVTVGAARPPVAPPQTTGELAPATLAVANTLDIDVAGAFTGTIDSYIVVPDDATIVVSERSTRRTIQLTGLTGGATGVRVVAVNTGGIATRTLPVTVTDPTKVAISATAPTHCLTGEGTPITLGANTGRTGIATIDITYTITDGTPPYVITSPDALATATTTEPTGTLTATCARTGLNPNNIAPTANAVESGPKTITLTITDTNGRTNTTTITTQIVEDAYTTEYNNGTLTAGDTYVLGTREAWSLITLPTGLDLEFEGLVVIEGEPATAYFADTISGSRIQLDWHTGREIYRRIVSDSTTRGAANSPPSSRDVGELFDSLAGSASTPDDVAYDGPHTDDVGNEWRPYDHLPDNTHVRISEDMAAGSTIIVCNAATAADFHLEDFGDTHLEGTEAGEMRRQQLSADFQDVYLAAIGEWNGDLHMPNDRFRGTPYMVFQNVPQATNCNHQMVDARSYPSTVDIVVHRRSRTPEGHNDYCAETNTATPTEIPACRARYHVEGRGCSADHGCARTRHLGDFAVMLLTPQRRAPKHHNRRHEPPGGPTSRAPAPTTRPKQHPTGADVMRADGVRHTLIVRTDPDGFQSTITHELGHFLGLGDYKGECPQDENGMEETTLFSYNTSSCRSSDPDYVTARDLRDLHSIYHPGALRDVTVGSAAITGKLATDDGQDDGHISFNAYYLAVWRRPASSTGNYTFVNSAKVFAGGTRGDLVDGEAIMAGGAFRLSLGGINPQGQEFLVAGATRGDHMRAPGAAWTAHTDVTVGTRGTWTLGHPTTVDGPTIPPPPPPPPPRRLGTPFLHLIDAEDVAATTVSLGWNAASNAPAGTTYTVRYAIDVEGEYEEDDDFTEESPDNPLSHTVDGLDVSTPYVFQVRAEHDGVLSNWSTRRTARTRAGTITVRGRIYVRRITPRDNDNNLELAFQEGTRNRILPTGRFVEFADLGSTWRTSSLVSGTVTGNPDAGERDFGHIQVRRYPRNADRFEVRFRSTRREFVEPRDRLATFMDMTPGGNWLRTSEFTFTIPASATSSSAESRSLDPTDELDPAPPGWDGCEDCSDDVEDMQSPTLP